MSFTTVQDIIDYYTEKLGLDKSEDGEEGGESE